MKTLLKLMAWLIGLVTLLAIIAVVAVPLFFNPNDFKDDIAQFVRAETGRELSIAGAIELSYFPRFGLHLGRLSLANPPGHTQPVFAAIGQADIHINVPALLQRELRIDTVILHGLSANLERDAQGTGNWQDLTGNSDAVVAAATADRQPNEATAEPQQTSINLQDLADFSIGGVDIREARIDWQDAGTAQHYTLSDLALQTGSIRPGQPVDITSRFQLQTNDPALSAQVALKSRVDFDPASQKLQIRQLDLQTSGLQTAAAPLTADWNLAGSIDYDIDDQTLRYDDLALNGTLQGNPAGHIAIAGKLAANLLLQQYRLDDLTIKTELSGNDLPGGGLQLALQANTSADVIKQVLTISDLNLETLGIRLNATIEGSGLLAQPQFSGSLEINPFNPRALLLQLHESLPATADPAALSQASLVTQFTAGTDTLNLEPLILHLDDATLQGRFSVPDWHRPALRYDLSLDAIDLDRYLPPPPPAQPVARVNTPGSATASTAAQGEIPLASLRSLDIDGTLKIGRLKFNRLQVSHALLPLRANGGILTLSPASAELYGGNYRGNIRLDVNAGQPAIAINEALTNIQAGPLLQALASEERILGTANATAQLTMSGASAAAIRSSLNGVAQFEFRDGTYRGVNVPHMLRQAQATLSGEPLPPDDVPQQTDFSELSFTLNFNDGVVSNDDLTAKSPLLRIQGQGNANLLSEQLDYGLTTTVVATAEGQGGVELRELQGIAIPIRISGTFAEPHYGLDVAALVKAHGEKLLAEQKDKLVQQAQEKLQQKVEQELGDKVGKELSDKVGKELGDALGEEAGKLLKGLFGN